VSPNAGRDIVNAPEAIQYAVGELGRFDSALALEITHHPPGDVSRKCLGVRPSKYCMPNALAEPGFQKSHDASIPDDRGPLTVFWAFRRRGSLRLSAFHIDGQFNAALDNEFGSADWLFGLPFIAVCLRAGRNFGPNVWIRFVAEESLGLSVLDDLVVLLSFEEFREFGHHLKRR
jgi:hypothetical protein